MLASMALFFTIIAYDNVVDYPTNYAFVQHVLSMDTTFQSPHLMGRAITSPTIHTIFYWVIIATEMITALGLWLSVFLLAKNLFHYEHFRKYKDYAMLSLFIGFTLYFVGFLIIAGEWFAMWQSSEWNAQKPAGLFASLLILMMLLINAAEQEST